MTQKQSDIIEQSTFLGLQGKIRIEFGENGITVYYTNDHYVTFIQIQ